uniref:Coiled-coil domain containing 62 n=1 Tax=Oryzias latipes TaxID=8090 RepID=A0A3P9ITB2_ORYLA
MADRGKPSEGKAVRSLWSKDAAAQLWHSTPVKQRSVGSGQPSGPMDRSTNPGFRDSSLDPPDSHSLYSLQETKLPVNDLSGSTIQRQRREIQLLMEELKDREVELNAMATSHHKQHQVWEQDRQTVLMLEQRCARLHEEVQKRNELIGAVTTRMLAVESREEEAQKELSAARQQLCGLQQEQRVIRDRCRDCEEKNQSLSSTVTALSTQVGSLQAREEELSSMLRLKEKDATEAAAQILSLSGRLRDVEALLTESRSQESRLLRDVDDHKRRSKEAKHEASRLKDQVQQQAVQSSTQREEIIRLKQELQLLHRDVALSGEGDSWKDELLDLCRSKQERIMAELHCLRQVCENQRQELQLLHLNQGRAPEALRQKTSESLGEPTCKCVNHQSPSSLGGKTPPPVQDPPYLTQGGGHLSRSSLQRLMDELLVSSEKTDSAGDGGTVQPRHPEGFPWRQQQPNASRVQARPTPPEACPCPSSAPWTA